jgi:hypothetical protein
MLVIAFNQNLRDIKNRDITKDIALLWEEEEADISKFAFYANRINII